jgi:Protein of unknown function (DUF3431)
LILYLNHSKSSSRSFAWSMVRYRSSFTALPEARGICPGVSDSSEPALIVARVAADGDVTWLDALADLYHLCVYTADVQLDRESVYLQVPANRGHEAMAYLASLIDNYAQLAAIIL